jgi:hypothetical protein
VREITTRLRNYLEHKTAAPRELGHHRTSALREHHACLNAAILACGPIPKSVDAV